METQQNLATETPQNFVTERNKFKINIATENSFESLECEDTEEEAATPTIRTHQNRSCPDIRVTEIEELTELKSKITSLEKKLLTAENEIENLSLENKMLKKEIMKYEQKTDILTNICRSTPKKKKTNTKASAKVTKLEFTHVEQRNKLAPSVEKNNTLEIIADDITTQHIEIIADDITTQHSKGENEFNKPTTTHANTQPHKHSTHRVLLLADEKGNNIRHYLQKILGENFIVTSFCKPNALVDQLLDSSLALCKDFSKEDFVILLTGSNDNNPTKLNAYTYFYIDKLCHTNVFLGEVYRNKYLNVNEINKLFNLICNNMTHAEFIHVNYEYKYWDKWGRLYTTRLIAKEILRNNYKVKYDKHMQEAHSKVKTRDAETQTNEMNLINLDIADNLESALDQRDLSTADNVEMFFRD